jgi:predicted membrane-bound mannosyltransferase
MFSLLDKVNEAVARSGKGTQTGIMIAAQDYWPLPWYLRDYPNAGYWGKVVKPTEQAVVIAEDSQEAELQQTLGDKYERAGSYELRPGVMLVVYVRK